MDEAAERKKREKAEVAEYERKKLAEASQMRGVPFGAPPPSGSIAGGGMRARVHSPLRTSEGMSGAMGGGPPSPVNAGLHGGDAGGVSQGGRGSSPVRGREGWAGGGYYEGRGGATEEAAAGNGVGGGVRPAQAPYREVAGNMDAEAVKRAVLSGQQFTRCVCVCVGEGEAEDGARGRLAVGDSHCRRSPMSRFASATPDLLACFPSLSNPPFLPLSHAIRHDRRRRATHD
jgi:hypothetical protein